jgi:hypothetical protein
LESAAQSEAREAAGLAYVCANLGDLRATLDEDGASALERLLAALRSGTAITPLLDELHLAVQRAGDALGIYGEQDRGLEAVGTERMEIVFRCPLEKCTGRPFDEVTEFPPLCSVNGAELIRDRLL